MANDDKPFLGKGWAFPIQLDASDEVSVAAYEEDIRQAVRIILGTAQGERVMRPDFGCGIADLVFSVGNTTTAGLVADEVRRALVRWEPRLELLSVDVQPDQDGEATLAIRISYRVRATNNVFNLVYPFYLEQGAG